jgi:hypothetical protein
MLCSATTTAADTLRPRASKGSLKQLDPNAAAPSFSPTTDDTAAAAASVPGSADDDNLLLRVLLPQKSMLSMPFSPTHTKPTHPKQNENHTNNTTLSISISLSSLLSQAPISLSLSLSLSLFNLQDPYFPSSSSPYCFFSSISQTHHLSSSPSPYLFLVFYLQNPSSLIFSMSLPCVLAPKPIISHLLHFHVFSLCSISTTHLSFSSIFKTHFSWT